MRKILDRYELGAPIASGGMGVLWEARDLRLNRLVAVKLVHRATAIPQADATRRFYREARITARIRHPGVPVVYDFGTDDGELFLVMEHVAGHTAADLVAEVVPVPVGWAAAFGAQVCAVLAAAHAMSLIHRDLKPSNILIGLDGSVKLLDLGLAAAVGLDEFSQITHSGQIPGTASYLAPEVAAGLPAEPRSDLSAACCMSW
jgi:non-specific serine/threonine protein kinase